MEKEKLFEQYKTLRKEKDVIPFYERAAWDRRRKVETFLEQGTAFRGRGIQEVYPQFSKEEIEYIFWPAKSRASEECDLKSKSRELCWVIEQAVEPAKSESIRERRRTKYRTACNEFLYEKFSHEAITLKDSFECRRLGLEADGKFEKSMTNPKFQFKLVFNDFFEPVLRYKELKQSLGTRIEELTARRKELIQNHESIRQNSFLTKSEKNQRWAKIQEELGKINKELKPQESRLEELSEVRVMLINNFIPDYQKEFEKFKESEKIEDEQVAREKFNAEGLKLVLEKMYNKFSKKFKEEYLNKE